MSRTIEYKRVWSEYRHDNSRQKPSRNTKLLDDTKAVAAGEYIQRRVATGVHILLAEHTLAAPLTKDSLLNFRKSYWASQSSVPISTCIHPLDTSVLEMKTTGLPSAPHLPTDTYLIAHTLISVESFLASISLLGDLSEKASRYPSIPALFCGAILRQDSYRDKHGMTISRLIMEHIDTHHQIISREVNIEIGSTYIDDPLPELRDEHCRCSLQRLSVLNLPRNRPDALAETASMHLVEIENFNAAQGLVDPLIAAKYSYSFEFYLSQLVKPSKSTLTGEMMTQHGHTHYVLPRRSRL